MRSLQLHDYCFRVFSGYCPWCGRRWVRKQFGAKGKGRLTPEQVATGPVVITYGYSLGAPAALVFARQLEREGIPIELAVTVDSKGFTQGIFPRNVKAAANFYEQQLFPIWFGKRKMRPEDALATHFLGNIQVRHVGHFTIPQSAPVRELLLETVRAVYDQEKNAVVGFEKGLAADWNLLPLRMPKFSLQQYSITQR
jgi:hypothetical protein